MASTPTTDATVPAEVQIAASTPVTAAPARAPKADAGSVEAAPEPAAVVGADPKPPAAAVAAKHDMPVPAPAATPVANKKAAAKAAPKPAATRIKSVPAPAMPEAVAAKEETIMEATIKNAAEKAKTLFTDANSKSTQAFAELNDFGKGNIEAIVESGKIAAKGIEAMGQDAADYSRKQFEGTTAVLKSLSSVKSPTDFFKLQSDYVRTSFDSMVAQTSKNTEAMLKLAGDVAQPLQNRVTIAVEKVKLAA